MYLVNFCKNHIVFKNRSFMKPPSLKYFIASLISFLVIICFNIIVSYIGNEGFNPSDDGVVLAQSYRLLNGEIPHKDFISIRPAGSGYLHILHFFFPIALMQSARWFVIIQYFLIALLFTSIIKVLIEDDLKVKMTVAQFVILLILAYTLSVLDYNLFLWTTIDAIMFSVLAFLLLISKPKPPLLNQIFALIFISYAALCRQTFLLPAAVLFLAVFIYNIKQHSFIKGIFVVIIGFAPIGFYLIMLVLSCGFQDFLSQMTGRTELLQTGFVQYVKYLLKSYGLILHLLVFGLFIGNTIDRTANSRLKVFLRNNSYFLARLIMLYMFVLIFYHFLDGKQNIYLLPFELFWLCIDIFLLSWISIKISQRTFYTALFVLFIAWTSSISLGDNSPIFASGLLAVMVLYLSMLISRVQYLKQQEESKIRLVFGIVLVLCVFVAGFIGQRKWNYRDLSAKDLDYQLSSVHSNFGNIKTNSTTGNYYQELKTIFDSLPNSKNRTFVLPNNAIFYPIFKTKNSLPLDWMQPAEYVGQEERVNNSVAKLCSIPGFYFVIDKIESKKMHEELKDLDFGNYDYLRIIFDKCEIVSTDYEYFIVYKSI